MKRLLMLFLVLLMLPSALAEITIQTDQHIYNLGNKIKASVSVSQDDFEGLFRLEAVCPNFRIQYFTTPISLEAGYTTAVDIPDLTVNPSMMGPCALNAVLLANDGIKADEKNSPSFFVTNELTVLPVRGEITALPGDSIQLAGVVNDAFGTNVILAEVEAKIGELSKAEQVIDGHYEMGILLPSDIKSGFHEIAVNVRDSKHNTGFGKVQLSITAVPSHLTSIISQSEIMPGQKIVAGSTLFDQAKDQMNETIDLSLSSPSGQNVFFKSAKSSEAVEYEFSQYAEPGTYTLTASYGKLTSASEVVVGTVKEVKVRYENQTVFVENMGNLLFSDELTFILENGLNNIPITKKLEILPGKLLSIDLSKEVPGGIYDIVMPIKEGVSTLKDNLQYVFQQNGEMAEKNYVAEGVEISDNRPIFRKIASGFSSITGNLTGVDGFLTRNPLTAPLLLGGLVLFLGFKYARKPIMRLFRKDSKEEDKKEENNEFS